MYGLINRAIQRFVIDTYGSVCWEAAMLRSDLGLSGFEAMLSYDTATTGAVVDAVAGELGRPVAEVLEDIGTYLVSHPNSEAVRRLLRFGGEDFTEFLHSLEDLPDRARLAVSDLDLPQLELSEYGLGCFRLSFSAGLDGFGHAMIGLLRSMADDYGALVLLAHNVGEGASGEMIEITLIDAGFATGRSFVLAGQGGAGQ
ncbi:heme NO-binding domain-containing protein [Aquicoccus sp. G2-2]|uniref:heme NO-binding domain-containing protein n=1 Tax=Aquicoccus sp. G2-2 TaxID=3092120 RepID=UPI002ADFE735|nr:heme NO-binding domain-containing protein [Aquicoccus sp. G2-2]MEA1113778.1 heme NO-binding domain-containing protein [Aquicoccus sp. G2-2]